MKILVDVDNIIGNLCDAVLSVYNEDSGDNLCSNDITSYYIENFVKPQYKDNFKHYFLDKRVWKRMKYVDGCREYIAKLFNDGHDIYFCTKTEMKNAPKKESYLQRTFPYINIRKKLIVCSDKTMIRADVLIDDCLDNFGGQNYSIVLDYPWNRNNVKDNIIRAENWEEIYEIIASINEEIKLNRGNREKLNPIDEFSLYSKEELEKILCSCPHNP